jgi:hypothetical protein
MVFILAFMENQFISNSFSIQPELMFRSKVMRSKCKRHNFNSKLDSIYQLC